MMLDTKVGQVEASRLAVVTRTQEIAAGTLTSKEYYLEGELVKCDQTVDVSQEVFDKAMGSVGTIKF